MAKKKTNTRELAAMLEALQRQRRDCSIGMYLLLLELNGETERSSLSLDRRLRNAGMQNPRQLLSTAMVHGWIAPRDEEDSRYWRLTAAGYAVVAGLQRRIELARAVEPRVAQAEQISGQMELFD